MDLKNVFPLTITEEDLGQRLDSFLAGKYPQISRARWTKLIDEGSVTVNNKEVKASYKIKTTGQVHFNQESIKKPDIKDQNVKFSGPPPEIIYENKDYLVLNKAEGLSVHPGAGTLLNETLVAWLLQEKKIDSNADEWLHWDEQVLEEQRPGIVHRLDKGTSGVLVVAKDPKTHTQLAEQFSDRTAGRLYWAVVRGKIDKLVKERPRRIQDLLLKKPCPLAFKISDGIYSFASLIERDPVNRVRFRVAESLGKMSITHFTQVSQMGDYSLLEMKLETGRTHQIRVHLSALGFPVMGDDVYGGERFERIMLHAHTLQFVDPKTKKKVSYEAPWPTKDQNWLQKQKLKLESPLKKIFFK